MKFVVLILLLTSAKQDVAKQIVTLSLHDYQFIILLLILSILFGGCSSSDD